MQTNLVTIGTDASVYRALELLVEYNITGLPVVDDDMHLLGIVSEKDMMNLMIDDDGDDYEPKTVEDVMTTDITSFDINDDLIAVCECLTKSNFRRVPILSKGKLIGIISRKDLIKYISEPIG